MKRLSASAGVIAPVLFASLVIGLGLLEPGYNHRTQMMSILGGVGGVRGAIFNVGIALTGALLVAFAPGLHQGIDGSRGSPAGPVLIALAGLGLVGSAVFPCNRGCTNILAAPTSAGAIHSVSSLITGACIAIAPLVLLPRLKNAPRWVGHWGFTLAMGVLGNVAGLLLWGSFLIRRIPAWEGLLQRLGIAFPLLWVGAMAAHLWDGSDG